MKSLDTSKAAVRIRREQLAFDNLPEEERSRMNKIGLDPYESEAVRARKKKAERERRKKDFDKLPKERRDALTMSGASPYQDEDAAVRRESGSIKVI